MAYIYVVRCEDHSLYTGIARDVKARVVEHYYRTPRAAKYTKSHQVCGVAGVWECEKWGDAARFEAAFKRIPKDVKETVLQCPRTAISTCGIYSRGKLDTSLYTTVEGITLQSCLAEVPRPKDASEHTIGKVAKGAKKS
ncbi:MAG: GIY-YIG nuclease family protein [Eubacterium sp.]|nr:GIY-YIG nuclease family protein [Eubacterium sp.]